jgi:hypothetical protein
MDVVPLSSWECCSYLHCAQELKVYLHPPNPNMRQRRWLELIKDYDLEVHYHPRKVNVVADALSRMVHCNYLPAVPLTGEESSIRMPPNVSLFNVTLTPNKTQRSIHAWWVATL